MKDIVIIANFCRDFSETDNGRFVYLCKELSKEHQVEIITSDFSHVNKSHKGPLEHNWPFKVTFLHEPGYKKNVSVRRFLSHRAWGKKVKKYLKKRGKPDVVYCAVPSLTAPLVAAKYCEKHGVRFIIDVQDLWPEAFQMVLNIPVISKLLFSPFKRRANNVYKMADAICGVSQRYVDRALSVNQKCQVGTVVFLGTNLQTFDYNSQTAMPVLQKRGDEIWLGYCGSLAASYDIPCVISALKMLQDEGFTALRFIVMGEGPRRAEFEKDASDAGIKADFLGRLPYDQMCAQLVQCDIVVNPIVKGSAASIINKHGDYAAAGKAVLNTQENQEYRDLIVEYQMGFNVDSNNAEEVAKNLRILIEDKELRNRMGQNARRCAVDFFDRSQTYQRIIRAITR